MQSYPEDSAFEVQNPIDNSDLNLEEIISKLPTHIRDFYSQLLKPSNENLQFCKDVEQIVQELEEHFKKPPRLFKAEWKKRKKDREDLEAAINTAASTGALFPLILECDKVANQTENFFLTFISWNSFPSKIRSLLKLYHWSMMKFLVAPTDPNQQKYLKLVRDNQALHGEMIALKNELEANKNHQASREKRESHSRFISIKDQIILSMQDEEKLMEQENGIPHPAPKKHINTLDFYKRQNQKLTSENNRLAQEIETVHFSEKQLKSENKLLKITIQRLEKENSSLSSKIKARDLELSHLNDKDRKFLHLQYENKQLKQRIDDLSQHLQTNSVDLELSKSDIIELREKINAHYTLKVAKFNEASMENEKKILALSEKLLTRVDKLGKKIQAIELPQEERTVNSIKT